VTSENTATRDPSKPHQYGYICLFNGRQWEVYADNMLDAQTQALAYFKPSKSKRHLVSVHVAEKPDGATIVHTPVD
jgi:hypothetical protein